MNKKPPGFLDTEDGKQFLLDRYVNGTDSAYVLAKELEIYENKIYRALRKYGFPRRSKGEAQRNALKKGTAAHPVKGKERPMSVKNKIGQKMHNYWKNIDKNDLEKRIEKSREIWYSIPEEIRKKWQKKANVSLRRASTEGSKFEKVLLSGLTLNGFKCEVHKKFMWENTECSIDIYLPIEGVAIELNGVSHFMPIFGEDRLKKTIERDLMKVEQLLANGYSVISIQNQKGYASKTVMDKFVTAFIPYLKEICNKETNTYNEILVEEIYNGEAGSGNAKGNP